MIEMAVAAAALLLVAVGVFALSLRLGMLVGRRMDRAIEERASQEESRRD
ncbi:MAG: hypothetical protein ACXWN4_00070 [Candidatus Limnocylindrales bacterium]